MKILLATSIITCTLLTGCWSVRTQKELLIKDDLNQPVENAKIYIIWHGAPTILFGEINGEKKIKTKFYHTHRDQIRMESSIPISSWFGQETIISSSQKKDITRQLYLSRQIKKT